MNKSFVFAMPRPTLNALKVMPGFLERILTAGDFACFYDSPQGAECVEDAMMIMYAPDDQNQADYIEFARNNFKSNNLLMIYEKTDAFHYRTTILKHISGYRATLIEKQDDLSVFFYIKSLVQAVQAQPNPQPQKKLVLLETFKPAIYQDLRKPDYANFIKSEMGLADNVSMTCLNDASDLIADSSTYFVVFQTPNACATNPSVLAFEMAHQENNNVLCVPSMKWKEVGLRLKEKCPELFT